MGGWVRLRVCLEASQTKLACPCQESKPKSAVHGPLHRLRHPGSRLEALINRQLLFT